MDICCCRDRHAEAAGDEERGGILLGSRLPRRRRVAPFCVDSGVETPFAYLLNGHAEQRAQQCHCQSMSIVKLEGRMHCSAVLLLWVCAYGVGAAFCCRIELLLSAAAVLVVERCRASL